jgi:hypothetical protein
MTTEGFIIELFCRIHDVMKDIPKPHQANLYPSEIVTLAVLFALKGVGNRAFYRWLARDFKYLFPRLPERTRLFRLFATHQDWANLFLVEPILLSVIDSYGIELIHPVREGRAEQQIGKKGIGFLSAIGIILQTDCITKLVNTFLIYNLIMVGVQFLAWNSQVQSQNNIPV